MGRRRRGHWHGGAEDYAKFRRGWYRRPKYNVPTNILETDTHYEVWVYALTFDKENIKISVVNNVLYISGTRTMEEGFDPHFVLQEYPQKSFERTFELNENVDIPAITAKQEGGILKIHVPKKQAATHPEQEVEIK